MDLVSVVRCESALPWFVREFESQSEPGVVHEVMVPMPTDGIEEFVCDCRGFQYRGSCRHIQEAWDEICRWNSEDGPEKQAEDNVCPRCGATTYRATEFV